MTKRLKGGKVVTGKGRTPGPAYKNNMALAKKQSAAASEAEQELILRDLMLLVQELQHAPTNETHTKKLVIYLGIAQEIHRRGILMDVDGWISRAREVALVMMANDDQLTPENLEIMGYFSALIKLQFKAISSREGYAVALSVYSHYKGKNLEFFRNETLRLQRLEKEANALRS